MSDSTVTLELFGMPRVVAGTDRLTVQGNRLQPILMDAISRHPALGAHVLNADGTWINNGYTFVVDGAFTNDPDYKVGSASMIMLVSRASGG
jgi:hypothetical protein